MQPPASQIFQRAQSYLYTPEGGKVREEHQTEFSCIAILKACRDFDLPFNEGETYVSLYESFIKDELWEGYAKELMFAGRANEETQGIRFMCLALAAEAAEVAKAAEAKPQSRFRAWLLARGSWG
jgi:hypothetical protein